MNRLEERIRSGLQETAERIPDTAPATTARTAPDLPAPPESGLPSQPSPQCCSCSRPSCSSTDLTPTPPLQPTPARSWARGLPTRATTSTPTMTIGVSGVGERLR